VQTSNVLNTAAAIYKPNRFGVQLSTIKAVAPCWQSVIFTYKEPRTAEAAREPVKKPALYPKHTPKTAKVK